MKLDFKHCYKAVCARDRRFDGLFFTAVKTTKIYCRCVCPAQTPKFENVEFVISAAEAEDRGYRPCLRCRPETAPGSPAWNGTSATVNRAVRLINEGAAAEGGCVRLNKRTFTGDLCRSQYISPVGTLEIICSSTGIRAILCEKDIENDWCKHILVSIPVEESTRIQEVKTQLDEYFEGGRKRFDLPLDPVGTSFQTRAWSALMEIPYGEVFSYTDQATKLGSPKLARAVGGANRSNPISIVVPCHRVAGKDGTLTGFAGGMEMKRSLLALEGKKFA